MAAQRERAALDRRSRARAGESSARKPRKRGDDRRSSTHKPPQPRRAAAERDRLAIERARQDALKAQSEAEQARAAAEAAKQAADAAKLAADGEAQQARLQAQQAQAVAAQAEQEKQALRERLREQLNAVLETRETARGLIVNVSDVLFDTGSATLKPGAREKLARVAGILATHPDLHIEIEGHTDSVGGDDYNQRLSERRSEAVRAYLVQQRIPPTLVDAEGFGESRPVASNDTACGPTTESPRRAGRHRRVDRTNGQQVVGRRWWLAVPVDRNLRR